MLKASVEHHAIFRCPEERWWKIAAAHTRILARYVGLHTKVVDVGCGWGRLLDLTPPTWEGAYVGIDLCGAFVHKARTLHPGHLFIHGEATETLRRWDVDSFDLAILVSFRPMVIRNLGEEYWQGVHEQLLRVSKRQLYLEYDPSDEGSLE